MPDGDCEAVMSRPKHQTDGDGRLNETFRQERLEHLRKSISEGTYHVSNRSVAGAIMRQGLKEVFEKSKNRG
jgi:anti-sigma28 factor (negative regulator of flagellin synthesis)